MGVAYRFLRVHAFPVARFLPLASSPRRMYVGRLYDYNSRRAIRSVNRLKQEPE